MLYLESVGLGHVWVSQKKIDKTLTYFAWMKYDGIVWICYDVARQFRYYIHHTLPLIPHYIFVYCYTTKKQQYNTTTDYESNHNILQSNITTVKLFPKPGSPKKNNPPTQKTSSRWWFQKFVMFIPTKYLGKCLDSIWLYNIFSDGWFNHQQVIVYRVFFPQKSVPSADLGCRSQCLGAQERVVPQFWRQDRGVGCHAATLRKNTGFGHCTAPVFGGVVKLSKLNGIQIWGDPKFGVDQTYCNANLWRFLRDFPYCDSELFG